MEMLSTVDSFASAMMQVLAVPLERDRSVDSCVNTLINYQVSRESNEGRLQVILEVAWGRQPI